MTSRLRSVVGRRRYGVALLAVAGALAGPSAASAAVTIGENTTTPGGSPIGCSTDPAVVCTYAPDVHPSLSYTSPIDGVIVRWRIRGNSQSGQMALRVLRKDDADTWTGIATSEPKAVIPGVENVFSTRLRIRAGQAIGLNLAGGSPLPVVEIRIVSGSSAAFFNPALADGETRDILSTVNNRALVLNADVEPDADNDGFGDETQDQCPTDASKQNECVAPQTTITKQPKDKTKKKQATFEFTSSELGSTFLCGFDGDPLTPCTSPETEKVGKGKHEFDVVAVDAAGNKDATPAEDSWKVKKKKQRKKKT